MRFNLFCDARRFGIAFSNKKGFSLLSGLMIMKQRFYSNGKLLLTGEYVVLDGALALALPTKSGQDLFVDEGQRGEIYWKSFNADGSIWFEDRITFENIRKHEPLKEVSEKNTLITILHEACLLNPDFLKQSDGYNITTHLTFPKLWGLGTSSTLINNIAQWFRIDAFTLLKRSFGGSGYDVACAQYDTPILYKLYKDKPFITIVDFNPDFLRQLYFVYLNKKQDSKAAIGCYRQQPQSGSAIDDISLITKEILNTQNVTNFKQLVTQHEKIISDLLKIETVQKSLFPDFHGTIKSLGAWGGDFALAISDENPTNYFKSKGFDTVVPYQQMIL